MQEYSSYTTILPGIYVDIYLGPLISDRTAMVRYRHKPWTRAVDTIPNNPNPGVFGIYLFICEDLDIYVAKSMNLKKSKPLNDGSIYQ